MSSKEKHPLDEDGRKEKVARPSSPSSMPSSVGSTGVDQRSDDRNGREKSKKRDSSRSRHRKRKKEGRSSDRKSRKRHLADLDKDSSASSASMSYASSYDSSSDDDLEGRKKKKRKRSHDNKKKNKRMKEKKEKKSKKKKKNRSKDTDDVDDGPVFGKYGIIKFSDMPAKQRSFEMWMEQVKGIPGFTGPKWELQNYFKEYAEDFNTATLPHIKYYDYDKWEMDEYKKNMAKAMASSTAAPSREAAFHQEQQSLARNKQKDEFNLVKSMMNKEKIEEMKRQKQLQSEMAHAFKTGDHQRYQQLKNRLEREK